ncbi:MAG TPA: hypothetical protein ENI59_00315 [Euryarchaeota archaeon]|nr:hypothetical protein [Euryarchaeota archaeon]
MRVRIKLLENEYEVNVPRRTEVHQIETDIYGFQEDIREIDPIEILKGYTFGSKVAVVVDADLRNPIYKDYVDLTLSRLHSLGAFDDEIILFFTSKILPESVPSMYLYRYNCILSREFEGRPKAYVTLSTLEDLNIEVHRIFERNFSRGYEAGIRSAYVISEAYVDGIYGIRTGIMALFDFLSPQTLRALIEYRIKHGLLEFMNLVKSLKTLPPFSFINGGIVFMKDFSGRVVSNVAGNLSAIHDEVVNRYLSILSYYPLETYDVILLGTTAGRPENLHRALVFTQEITKEGSTIVLYAEKWMLDPDFENIVSRFLTIEDKELKINSYKEAVAYEIAKILSKNTILLVGEGESKLFKTFTEVQDAIDIAIEKALMTTSRPKMGVVRYADYSLPAPR